MCPLVDYRLKTDLTKKALLFLIKNKFYRNIQCSAFFEIINRLITGDKLLRIVTIIFRVALKILNIT